MPRILWHAAYGVMVREGPRGLQVLLGRREGGQLQGQYDFIGTKLRSRIVPERKLLHTVRESMVRAFTAKTGIKADYAEPLPDIVREGGQFKAKPWFMFGPLTKKRTKVPAGYSSASWYDVSRIVSFGTGSSRKWYVEERVDGKTARYPLAGGVGETISHAQNLHHNYQYYVDEVLMEAAKVDEESWAEAVANSRGKLDHPIYWTAALLVDRNWDELARGFRTQPVTQEEHGPGDVFYHLEHWKNHAEEVALEIYRRNAGRRGLTEEQMKEELREARMIMVTKPCHERSLGVGRISCAERILKAGVGGILFIADDLNRKIKDAAFRRKSKGVMILLRNGVFVNALHQSSPATYIALMKNRNFNRQHKYVTTFFR